MAARLIRVTGDRLDKCMAPAHTQLPNQVLQQNPTRLFITMHNHKFIEPAWCALALLAFCVPATAEESAPPPTLPKPGGN